MELNLKERKESLTQIYSGMSPVELKEEYNAYVKDKDFGMFYKVLMKEIAFRKQDNSKEGADKMAQYGKFLSESDRLRLNPENIFQDLDKKGKLLEDIMEYATLQGNGRSIKTLIILDDERVGKAFQSNYNTAKKHLCI